MDGGEVGREGGREGGYGAVGAEEETILFKILNLFPNY